jgi:hypothetical protein
VAGLQKRLQFFNKDVIDWRRFLANSIALWRILPSRIRRAQGKEIDSLCKSDVFVLPICGMMILYTSFSPQL